MEEEARSKCERPQRRDAKAQRKAKNAEKTLEKDREGKS